MLYMTCNMIVICCYDLLPSGYSKLHLFSRDNFYVRAKISHKSRSRLELSFDVGDTFHVTDTKPKGILFGTKL